MKKIFTPFILLIMIFGNHATAQVAINTIGAEANSHTMLDISSDSKGLLIPRLTTVQQNALASNIGTAENGLLVFNSDDSAFYYWNGTAFIKLNSGDMDKIVDANGDSKFELTDFYGTDYAALTLEDTVYFKFKKGYLEFLNNGNSVFIGYSAGINDDKTNNQNVFIGYKAGFDNTSGDHNIALGPYSLQNNTTGKSNFASGYSALSANTEGNSNLAFGENTLHNNTSGNKNIALGEESLYSNQTGDYNISVGNSGLNKNTSGEKNISIGFVSSYNNTTGEGNITLGHQANYFNQTGSHNTIIGTLAGVGSMNTSRSGSVFLGYQAGYNETSDNKLYIENSSSSTPLIGGDFSVDRVDINGTVKITGGNPASGKFLKSDAAGLASWDSISLNSLVNTFDNDTSIFMGYHAGINDSGNTFNVGIGREAAFKNETGTENVAIGYQALYYNINGSHNTAVGAYSLNSYSSAGNTAIGNSSLKQNRGNANTAVGRLSSQANILGWGNTSLGYLSNFYNSSGYGNTIIGYGSGHGGSAHSKSGCVFIGYKSGFYEQESNKLYIENSDTTAPLIGGDFALDEVYINGTLKITGGNPGAGKVLTSDTAGNASWQLTSGVTELNDLTDAVYDSSRLFVGYQAGTFDDGNNNNTALGSEALKTNNTGSNNSAMGAQALFSNSTGENNTATGYNTLYINDTGVNNTAIGSKTLYNNNSNDNTAMGFETLYSNISGEKNSALGSQVLYNNSTGSNNTAIGYRSLNQNLNGYKNTALGSETLGEVTSGHQNVSIGSSSGSLGNVNNCTFIGVSSGSNSSTSRLNSTAIGFQTTITASNQIRFGNTTVTSIGGYADWTNISDGRFKSSITEDVKGLDFILKLRPVSYNLDIDKINRFIGKNRKSNHGNRSLERQTGFIAQEVEQAAETLGFEFSGVDKPKNENDYYGLRYAQFVVPLVKAVQEQQQLIEQQQQLINQLIEDVKTLKAQTTNSNNQR